MSKHAKVKTKNVGIDMEELNKVMEQMTGVTKPEPIVINNKFNTLLEAYQKLSTGFHKMATTFEKVKASDGKEVTEMMSFVDELNEVINGERKLNFMEHPDDQFKDYNNQITSDLTKKITKCYGDLEKYHIHLSDPETIDSGFIMRHPTDNFVIIPSITSWDIKKMLRVIKGGDKFKNYCMQFLCSCFKNSKLVYETVTSPNVDPKHLANVLIEAISAHEKMFPRHKLAFNALRRNVKLLETNVNGYFKEFLSSKDSSCFIHNFIMDVAEDSNNIDVKTKMQLKDLLFQLKKSIKNKEINDPKLRSMMDSLGSSLPFLDKEEGPMKSPEDTPEDNDLMG